jgi:hypothetical protein
MPERFVHVRFIDRKGFSLDGDMIECDLHHRITRCFPVRTAAVPTCEPTRRDGQPYAIVYEVPVETLAFEMTGLIGDVYIYREVID